MFDIRYAGHLRRRDPTARHSDVAAPVSSGALVCRVVSAAPDAHTLVYAKFARTILADMLFAPACQVKPIARRFSIDLVAAAQQFTGQSRILAMAIFAKTIL